MQLRLWAHNKKCLAWVVLTVKSIKQPGSTSSFIFVTFRCIQTKQKPQIPRFTAG